MWIIFIAILFVVPPYVAGQDQTSGGPNCNPEDVPSTSTTVVVTVFSTLLVVVLIASCVFFGFKFYKKWKARKGQHLMLETDPERGKGEYAFDNPGFKDAALTPSGKSTAERSTKEEPGKLKWNQWSPLSVLNIKNETKRTTLDDSEIEDQVKVVTLRSHDFTGLGFNICGNMKEGIYIKDILHRGPASESKQLNAGDRIRSVTINFDHVVYEDALAILSYASPYEIAVAAQSSTSSGGTSILRCFFSGRANGGNGNGNSGGGKLVHPIYRSSSNPSQKTKKRLFDESAEFYSPKTTIMPTKDGSSMETQKSSKTKTVPPKPTARTSVTDTSPKRTSTPSVMETSTPKSEENTVQKKSTNEETKEMRKFGGVQVLPTSTSNTKKTAPECTQNNVNNVNHEHEKLNINGDQTNKKLDPPSAKKREKLPKHNNEQKTDDQHLSNQKIVREEVIHIKQIASENKKPEKEETITVNHHEENGDVRRDANNVPMELPSSLLNAANAARNNRKSLLVTQEDDSSKSARKKGKAPAPPGSGATETETTNGRNEDCFSDSDIEEEKSKVEKSPSPTNNKIELNASDITIHHQSDEENTSAVHAEDDNQDRKTLSTGDLTKIQKRSKSRSGTLERAQSLDITDSAISQDPPPVAKKRKANDESHGSSQSDDESSPLHNKEPRLSAILLDGLNTFQRSRLKKSTEWGNLEDAILNATSTESVKDVKDEEMIIEKHFEPVSDLGNFNFGSKTSEFDALVNKINEIKQETKDIDIFNTPSPMEDSNVEEEEIKPIKNKVWPFDDDNNKSIDGGSKEVEEVQIVETEQVVELKMMEEPVEVKTMEEQPKIITVNEKVGAPNFDIDLIQNFLEAERMAASMNNDTNIPDDIKVSRHSFIGIAEGPKSKTNVSNVTINAQNNMCEVTITNNEQNQDEMKPDLIKNIEHYNDIINNEELVTIDGPSSLTLEINQTSDDLKLQQNAEIFMKPKTVEIVPNTVEIHHSTVSHNNEPETKSKYITEIQVLTMENNEQEENNTIDIDAKKLDEVAEEDFEKYIRKFESNIKTFESNIHNFETNMTETMNSLTNPETINITPNNKSITQITDEDIIMPQLNVEKELQKVQEMAEEQLKKLPEMRFSTSSYESSTRPANSQMEKRHSQIEILRSNFERPSPNSNNNNGPPLARNVRSETSPPKSRIPVLNKTPPTSPERRDSKNFDQDKELMEMMVSKYQQQSPTKHNKNITVTSIKNNSKIPSGVSIYSSKPPVPPKKSSSDEDNDNNSNQFSNGSTSSTFKQWVFGPGDSVTNITVSDPNKIL